MPLLTVVIPARNRVNLVEECLDSVYAQKLPRGWTVEVILVDNLSVPPLKEVIKPRPSLQFKTNRAESGPGGSRNIGLSHAKGDLIAFLDSDDVWTNNFISEAISELVASKSKAILCFSKLNFMTPYPIGMRIKWSFLNLIKSLSLLYMYYFNRGVLSPSAFYLCQISHLVFNRKQIGRVRFIESVPAAEDWYFIVDFLKHDQIKIIPKRLVRFRYEIKSFTNSPDALRLKWIQYMKLINDLRAPFLSEPWHWMFVQYIRGFSK